MPKMTLEFNEDIVLDVDVSKNRFLAIHKSFSGAKKKGYVITHIPTMACVLWCPLKRDATQARSQLESLDWSNYENVRPTVQLLQAQFANIQIDFKCWRFGFGG